MKEKTPCASFRKAAGQGLGKPTKGASLRKRRPLLTYPWAWKAKTAEGYIAKEVPLGLSLIPKGYMAKGACNASPPVTGPKGYIDKAAKISCATDRPKRTFFKRKFRRKLKEKSRRRFPGGGGPGTRKTDQKVHR